MSSADYFRLFVLCLWLLDGDVSCENTQKGYVLRVQAGQAPMGVHSDDRDYKRWRELPNIFRISTAGFKTSSEDRRQSSSVYHAQEDHTTNSKLVQIQNRYLNPVIPETQNSNFQKSQVNHFKSGFNSASLTQGQSPVVDNHSGNNISISPESKKIHQANFGSVFSTDAVQVPPHMHQARTKLTGGFSSIQVEKATIGFGQNNKEARINAPNSAARPNIQDIKLSLKPESHTFFINPSRPHRLHLQESDLTIRPEVSGYLPAPVFPNNFNHARPNLSQKDSKPINKKMNSVVTGYSAGSNLAGKVDTQMSHPAWSPRFYSSDVMPGARGYAHVRHIKPGFDKTRPQASSAAGGKFFETGSRGSKHGSWPPPSPDRAQMSVQGKFKPFQRIPTNNDLPVHTHSSDRETAPSQTSAGTTLPPSLNSTGITSSVVPSVKEELSTKSAPPLQTEGQDAELIPQTSNHEGQSESVAEVGPSMERNKPFTVSPPKLEPADEEEKDDRVVSSPPENDPSEV